MPDTVMSQAEAPYFRNRSPNTAALAAALAVAQGNFASIPKDREVTVRTLDGGTYKFRYATLDAIMGATVPALAEQGLAISQALTDWGNNFAVETTLYHSSGEWISNVTPMFLVGRRTKDGRELPPGNQELGSAQTYARRYGVSALLCITADEDDDGNHADGNHAEGSERVPFKPGARGTAGGGAQFRSERRSSWGAGGKQGAVDEAKRDGLMDGAQPKPLPGAPAKRGAPPPGNNVKRAEWVTASIAGFKSLPTKEALGDWWRENKERLDIVEGAMPTEYERLVVAYDAAMDAAVAKVA